MEPKSTQQRVIDNVTISIEPSTPFNFQQPSGDDLLMFYIGESGLGSAILWLHRSEVPRMVTTLIQAMGATPEAPAAAARPVPDELPAVLEEVL